MPPSAPVARPAAVTALVLTGGGSTRMGTHKPALLVGDRSMVERVLDAVRPWPALVVGRGETVPSGIPLLVDDGGGPVAAVAAGLRTLVSSSYAAGLGEPASCGPQVVVVLAGDLPFVTHQHLQRLVSVLDSLDVEVAVEVAVTTHGERSNWLCSAWRVEALQSRLTALGDPRDRSMRDLAADASRIEVPDEDLLATDVDTPDDLDRARRRVGQK